MNARRNLIFILVLLSITSISCSSTNKPRNIAQVKSKNLNKNKIKSKIDYNNNESTSQKDNTHQSDVFTSNYNNSEIGYNLIAPIGTSQVSLFDMKGNEVFNFLYK